MGATRHEGTEAQRVPLLTVAEQPRSQTRFGRTRPDMEAEVQLRPVRAENAAGRKPVSAAQGGLERQLQQPRQAQQQEWSAPFMRSAKGRCSSAACRRAVRRGLGGRAKGVAESLSRAAGGGGDPREGRHLGGQAHGSTRAVATGPAEQEGSSSKASCARLRGVQCKAAARWETRISVCIAAFENVGPMRPRCARRGDSKSARAPEQRVVSGSRRQACSANGPTAARRGQGR